MLNTGRLAEPAKDNKAVFAVAITAAPQWFSNFTTNTVTRKQNHFPRSKSDKYSEENPNIYAFEVISE